MKSQESSGWKGPWRSHPTFLGVCWAGVQFSMTISCPGGSPTVVDTCPRDGENITLHPLATQPGSLSPSSLLGYTAPQGSLAARWQSCSPSGQSPTSMGQGDSPSCVQGFGLVLPEFHEDPVGLFLQPMKAMLSGSPALKHIDCTFGVTCELEGAFCPLLGSLLGPLGQGPGKTTEGSFPW